MSRRENRGRAGMSWLFVGALFVLCAVLGIVQYRWIAEVSVADRDRLRATLQASLNRVSHDLNSEVTSAIAALVPPFSGQGTGGALRDYTARYAQWKATTPHGKMFSRVAVVLPENDAVALRRLNLDSGVFEAAEWPDEWTSLKQRFEQRRSGEPRQGRRPPIAGPDARGLVFEIPRFAPPPEEPRPGPFVRREADWLIVELNPEYLRQSLLPESLHRHLAAGGSLGYEVEVVSRAEPRQVIYRSDPDQGTPVSARADASVGLLEVQFDQIMRAAGAWRGGGPGPRRVFGPDMGRLQMFVRHRAGSLDAVVASARRRNLAVTGGILLLMVATAAALIRFTRNAQRLAGMQMNFVAGVSHELRTPLTVIHTAAYNLRGGVARNPGQVERYGTLIHQESGRLANLVEQVLRFANANAGRTIQKPRPVSVESVIEDAMASSQADIDEARSSVETHIDSGLPLVMGDPLALKHALQNLITNAAKYGTGNGKWIGVYASATGGREEQAVEIRVADHGPGIPADEQKHIFDPFFRGSQALRDQVHGTGLGLNLAKKIVEAHGGGISVKSEVMKGTEFIVRLPAAPADQQDEFTNSISRG